MAALLRRTLGSGPHALTVSAQGFGCMGMTANYGDPMPEAAAIELIKAVYEQGVTFWDTAEAYCCDLPDGSTLYNESVLGVAIRTLALPRAELQLATKYMVKKLVGYTRTDAPPCSK
jgi:aryl-alcohol dehydrogenase-like predicted oxidoreductase